MYVCDDWPFWINKENITRAVSITMNVNYYKRIFRILICFIHVNKDYI